MHLLLHTIRPRTEDRDRDQRSKANICSSKMGGVVRPGAGTGSRVDRVALDIAAAAGRARPVVGAESRLIEVPGPLAPLFPEGGLRQGTTVAIEPPGGGASLALALAASVTAGGGWVAAVGLSSLGLVAADEMGVDLRHLALVPAPGRQWAAVVAALIDGFELLMVQPPAPARPVEARRLAARVKERGAVLLVVGAQRWPESPDLRLSVGRPEWEGLGAGHGCLTGRRVEVEAGGRRIGGRPRRCSLWLPAPGSGRMEDIVPAVALAPVVEMRASG